MSNQGWTGDRGVTRTELSLVPGDFGGGRGCQPNDIGLELDGYRTFDAICAWPANPDHAAVFVEFRI